MSGLHLGKRDANVVKDIHEAELRTLINTFEPKDLALVLQFIAERIAHAPAVVDDEFDVAPETRRERHAALDRMQIQALVHEAYQEAGFVVVDIADGYVGILNASPQIVRVTNHLIDMLVARISRK